MGIQISKDYPKSILPFTKLKMLIHKHQTMYTSLKVKNYELILSHTALGTAALQINQLLLESILQIHYTIYWYPILKEYRIL